MVLLDTGISPVSTILEKRLVYPNLKKSGNNSALAVFTLHVGKKLIIEEGFRLSGDKGLHKESLLVFGNDPNVCPYVVVRRGIPKGKTYFCSLMEGKKSGLIELLSVPNPTVIGEFILVFVCPDEYCSFSYKVSGLDTLYECRSCGHVKKYVLPNEFVYCEKCRSNNLVYKSILGKNCPGELINFKSYLKNYSVCYSLIKMHEGDAFVVHKNLVRYDKGTITIYKI